MIFYIGYHRVVGEIRGKQIAYKLSGVYTHSYPNTNEKVILIKSYPVQDGPNYFIDVVDHNEGIGQILKNKQSQVIAFSATSADYLKRYIKNNIYVIPQQHCNFENYTRDRKEVTTVGFVGAERSALRLNVEALSSELTKFGLNFVHINKPVIREDVIEFYKNIDIQLYFRQPNRRHIYFKDSLKLRNAGSFKIPTVCNSDYGPLVDFPDAFLPANSLTEFVKACVELKNNPSLYEDIANRAYECSQKFHISKILPLYEAL